MEQRWEVFAALVLWLACVVLLSGAARADEPPVIPVGVDAYLQWDKWPLQRIGARAYMRSTYDRRGGNESADASHFLYQLADDDNVSLDLAGSGILYFVRYNHWHGSPWHYVVDGKDFLVRETTTADPNHPATNSVFLPEKLFPPPLALTWADTQGADLSWVPIGFEKSFRMGYSRTHYGTGYYIYDQYVGGARLSRPITAWGGQSVVSPDVLELVNRSGSDISPTNDVTPLNGVIPTLGAPWAAVATLKNGPAMMRKFSLTVPLAEALEFGHARLRVTWDGRTEASVDAPVALFFGAGTLYNRDQRRYLVRSFPMTVEFQADKIQLSCYFPMPYFSSVRIELAAPSALALTNIAWSLSTQPLAEPPSHVGYFHTTYRDHPNWPPLGEDLVLLDTRQVEGGGDWSGSFVGTSWIFSDRAYLRTLEGDPRFFFDDSQTPQAQGTGTEEWGGGGDYWGGLNMTLPFAGHPAGARSPQEAKGPEDMVESAYRFLLGDLMPFGRNAVIKLEHGGTDESTEHYQSVAYWYGAPAASLIKTDELKIGDEASEKAHQYVSPQASAPYSITSRYEWGVDHFKGREVYPATTDTGRKTTGTSEFTLKLTPGNFGVLLRRKLDYSFPNQRAEVWIAHGDNWDPAGTWYLAGANVCVYSDPKEELGPAQHIVKTSNRRFRDDEFLVPRPLTQGRDSIRVRVTFVPVDIPLFAGHPWPELAWSEMRYDAYCFVMPEWQPATPKP
jgi:hypothetical protein